MKLRRRTIEVLSLSFLDCICCGFGAIILLLVLTEYGQPIQIEESRTKASWTRAVVWRVCPGFSRRRYRWAWRRSSS